MALTAGETMRALLDGKKVTAEEWSDNEFVFLRADDELVDQVGDEVEFSFGNGLSYELFERPYRTGTFEWARVEHADGAGRAMVSPSSGARMSRGRAFDEIMFYGRHVKATDWQVEE